MAATARDVCERAVTGARIMFMWPWRKEPPPSSPRDAGWLKEEHVLAMIVGFVLNKCLSIAQRKMEKLVGKIWQATLEATPQTVQFLIGGVFAAILLHRMWAHRSSFCSWAPDVCSKEDDVKRVLTYAVTTFATVVTTWQSSQARFIAVCFFGGLYEVATQLLSFLSPTTWLWADLVCLVFASSIVDRYETRGGNQPRWLLFPRMILLFNVMLFVGYCSLWTLYDQVYAPTFGPFPGSCAHYRYDGDVLLQQDDEPPHTWRVAYVCHDDVYELGGFGGPHRCCYQDPKRRSWEMLFTRLPLLIIIPLAAFIN